jgi:hypothetical protein
MKTDQELIDEKTRIFALFEHDLAIKLIEFSKTISSWESDVFLLMSRKFCCLYNLLNKLNLAQLNGPIISDKALDLNVDKFKGKRITIIDDIVICGTTLWKIKNKLLLAYSVKEVKVVVFCVNQEFWVKECINPDYKAVVLSDQRSLTFCTSIVRALSIFPYPYAIEFPKFADIRINISDWHLFISSQFWKVCDISDRMQEINNISVLSFFPTTEISNELRSYFGESFFQLLDIIKIRIYSRKRENYFQLTVMPIVTFHPLKQIILEYAFNEIINKISKIPKFEKETILLKEEFVSSESRLRFIQYIASIGLFKLFNSYLEKTLGKEFNYSVDPTDCALLFGYWNVERISKICNYILTINPSIFKISQINFTTININSTEFDVLFKYRKRDKNIKSQINTREPRNIFSDFSNIFLTLYNNKEEQTRAEVRTLAPQGNWEKIESLDRLETGITWAGILEYLNKRYKYKLTIELKNVLSLILDYSVDKGICVPVIRYNNHSKTIYRAYRHGEDVRFAEHETALCGHLIEKALKSSHKDSIRKLQLEKLLVLFIKLGITRDILQIQYGTTGQAGIAKIGFHLHGAIIKYSKPNRYRVQNDMWLSEGFPIFGHSLSRQIHI